MKKSTFLLMCLVIGFTAFSQWSSDPQINNEIAGMSGEEAIPKVASSASGITYIAWFSNENGNYNIRLQKLDIEGNKLWEEEGLLVSDHPSMSWLTDWDMALDHEDCAVLTFQDIRNGDNDAFAYRISPEGEFLYGEDGVELSSGSAFDAAPKVCITDGNDAVFAWQADDVVIYQRVSPEGTKLWGDDGITLSGTNTYSWPQMLAVSNDEIMLKYFEDSGPVWAPTRHVFAQRLDVEGNDVWDSPAIISNAGGISAWTQIFPMISDGNDGFYIAWHDDRDNNSLASVFVQHIGFDGQILFGDDGTEASTQLSRNHFYPTLALPQESEEIFVYWNEMDADQNNRGIYGQKLSTNGERLWTDNGKPFIELSLTDVYPTQASPVEEDVVMFYETNSSGTNATIYAMRLDKDGEFVWNDEMVPVCSLPTSKVHTVVGNPESTQWIVSWEDDRSGNKDIYAQNLKSDGTLGPVPAQPIASITPDTLWLEENMTVYSVYVINESLVDVVVDSVIANAVYWFIEELPEFPHTITPGDTFEIHIPVSIVWTDQTDDYDFDSLNVYLPDSMLTSMVAFNLDILEDIQPLKDKNLNSTISPNPVKIGETVNIKSSSAIHQLELIDLKGKVLDRIIINNEKETNWDLPVGPEAGVYFIKIETESSQSTKKIILR